MSELMKLPRNVVVAGFAIAMVLPSLTWAQESESEKYHQAFQQWARDYQIATPSGRSLELREEPLLKWTNPVRNSENGTTFVWMDAGNPLAIGSFFTFFYNEVRGRHEFHSLSQESLRAEFRDQLAWEPKEPGVKWAAISTAPPAAKSKPRRLLQMKRLAQEFKVRILPPPGQGKTADSDLRLLSQPLLRFESEKYGIIDGAIFSYVIATDPEALLLIRNRNSDDGAVWEYAFARFHYWALRASHQDQVVWDAEQDLSLIPNYLGDAAKINDRFTTFYPEKDRLFRP